VTSLKSAMLQHLWHILQQQGLCHCRPYLIWFVTFILYLMDNTVSRFHIWALFLNYFKVNECTVSGHNITRYLLTHRLTHTSIVDSVVTIYYYTELLLLAVSSHHNPASRCCLDYAFIDIHDCSTACPSLDTILKLTNLQ
jgi:hypothetical protein